MDYNEFIVSYCIYMIWIYIVYVLNIYAYYIYYIIDLILFHCFLFYVTLWQLNLANLMPW